MDNRRGRYEERSDDLPYSRLFIVCERKLTEDHFHDAFSKFGTIEDIRMPLDHNTGELKGIAYIKFSKTSEAAAAVEEMNLKILPDTTRPLKVMVASSRSDIQSDDHDVEKYKRIFINVPSKNITETELHEDFAKFGHIESIHIQKDRNTGEPKGFAYIKYTKFSEAAMAFEQADRKYRAIFAQPKQAQQQRRPETAFESNINDLANPSILSMMKTRQRGNTYTRIMYLCSPYLVKRQVECLFNLIPGMVSCEFYIDLVRNCGKGSVSYSNPLSAAYAVENLDKFEYPPGVRIFVKPDKSRFDQQEHNFNKIPNVLNNLKNAISTTTNSGGTDLAQLAAAIAEASKLIKMATTGKAPDAEPDSNDLNYCSVKLPPQQPLADIDSPVAKRCFLVCKPQPPPLTVLRDVFCRFGNLINVYTLPNKTVGYARYATVESANNAIATLHGAEICSIRMKVIEAEDEGPSKRKRYD